MRWMIGYQTTSLVTSYLLTSFVIDYQWLNIWLIVTTPTQLNLMLVLTRKWLCTPPPTANSMSAISQLSLTRFWPNFKSRCLGSKTTITISQLSLTQFRPHYKARSSDKNNNKDNKINIINNKKNNNKIKLTTTSH